MPKTAGRRYDKPFTVCLSSQEDAEIIAEIQNTYGHGTAEKFRNYIRIHSGYYERNPHLLSHIPPQGRTHTPDILTPPPQKKQEPHSKVTITLPNERERTVYKLREQLWAALNDKSLSVPQYARNKASRYYYLGEGKLRRSEGRGGPDIEGAISQFDAGLSFMSRHMPTAAPKPEPDVLTHQQELPPQPKVTTPPSDWLRASPAERVEMANKFQTELHDVIVGLKGNPAAQKSALDYLQKGQRLMREKYDVVGAIRQFQAGLELYGKGV